MLPPCLRNFSVTLVALCALFLMYATPGMGMESRVQLTDIEQDGILERLTLQWDQSRLEVRTAEGDLLVDMNWLPTGCDPMFFDLNGDGYPDLVAGDDLLLDGRGLAAELLPRDGFGECSLVSVPGERLDDPFSEVWNSGDVINNIWDLDVADMDGDGCVNLVTQTFYYPGGTILVYECDHDNAFVPVWESEVQSSSAVTTICTGDTDGDGLMEIMAGEASNPGFCHLWENNGDNSFVKLPLDCLLGWQARGIEVCDLDDDGHLEYCLAGGEGGSGSSVKVLEHSGAPGENIYSSLLSYGTSDYVTGICTGDSDNDGRNEIVVQLGGVVGSTMVIRRLEYDPSGELFELKQFDMGFTAPILSSLIADLDGDSKNELLVGSTNFLMLLKSDEDDIYHMSWINHFPVVGQVLDITLGPPGSEGFPQIVFGTSTGQVDIFAYNGEYFELKTPESVFSGQLTRKVALGYFDGDDGMLDLILTRSFVDQLALFEPQTLTSVDWAQGAAGGGPELYPTTSPCFGGAELRLSLPASGFARLEIYDVLGRLVKLISDGQTEAGRHITAWDGTDDNGRRVAGGVYFARLTSRGQVAGTRLVLLR
jgi:hypothetical protein